jgi:hypothetical protein
MILSSHRWQRKNHTGSLEELVDTYLYIESCQEMLQCEQPYMRISLLTRVNSSSANSAKHQTPNSWSDHLDSSMPARSKHKHTAH